MHTQRGFTLIELLIVIGILGVLAVAFLPDVLSAGREGERAETEARIMFLVAAAKKYEREFGTYPSDNFVHNGKSVAKDNGVNTGIESLVAVLSQKRLSSDSLADNEPWLDNTDGDEAAKEIPLLERRDLMEVVDAWGMPLAYFSAHGAGYDKVQRIDLGDGDSQRVKALINPRTGKPAGAGKFQLISAGPDGVFGTEDDLTHPAIVREE